MEITSAPLIRWHLGGEDLMLAAPELFAYSFVPADGIKDGAWRLSSLLVLKERLEGTDTEKMRALLKEALKTGWDEAQAKAPEAEKSALAAMKRVIDESQE